MPPAIASIAVPIGLAIAGMVGQNVQNKSTNANNLNQKADAGQAWKQAQNKFLGMYPQSSGVTGTLGSGPPPPSGILQQPPGGANPFLGTGAGGPGAAPGSPPPVPQGGGPPPQLEAIMRRILSPPPGSITPVPTPRQIA